MFSRVEWLKLQSRHGGRARLPFALLYLLTFESYYRLCALLGYRPRHFLDPFPDNLRGLKPGDRYLIVWPHLPLPIRLLDRIFPGHVEFAPYTPGAVAEARAKGRRADVGVVRAGVLRSGGSFK
jgi:hypothetical protein